MTEWETSLQKLCDHCMHKGRKPKICDEIAKEFKSQRRCKYYKCSVKNDQLAFKAQTEQFIEKFLDMKKIHTEEEKNIERRDEEEMVCCPD